MISKQAATGFPGTGKIKADALKEASAQCQISGLAVEIIELTESEPPYVFGNYPAVQVTFRCVPDGSG